MTKGQKKIRDAKWPQRLDTTINERFGRETETFFDLFGAMQYVTTPTDDEPLTNEHHDFIRQ